MVRYLNFQTREDIVIVSGIYGALLGVVDRWNSTMKNPPKEVIGYIKASARFAARACKEMNKEHDNNEIARIHRMIDTTKFQLKYGIHDLSAKEEGVRTYDITEDEKDLLVEALTEVRCSGCNGCVKDCKVRTHLFKWDISPIHEVTDNKHPCQYMPPDEE